MVPAKIATCPTENFFLPLAGSSEAAFVQHYFYYCVSKELAPLLPAPCEMLGWTSYLHTAVEAVFGSSLRLSWLGVLSRITKRIAIHRGMHRDRGAVKLKKKIRVFIPCCTGACTVTVAL